MNLSEATEPQPIPKDRKLHFPEESQYPEGEFKPFDPERFKEQSHKQDKQQPR